MNLIKRNVCLSVLMCLLLVACHDNESVAPATDVSSEFVAGKLASVIVAEDYEVSFWEVSPGNIVLFKYRSVDADMVASEELKETLKMKNFVAMYKKLAGTAADPESIKKLGAAQIRRANPLWEKFSGKSKGVRLTSTLKTKPGIETGRTAAVCATQKNALKYFKDTYVTNNPNHFDDILGTPPFSQFYGPLPSHQMFNFIILNGQKSGNGNHIVAEMPGLWYFNLPAWYVAEAGATLGPGQQSWLHVSFVNGENCASNFVEVELFSW